ncbi:hypothetical protein S83_067425 [Arachis hypogaea]
MEYMGNQEDSENDLPLLPKSYEEFCEMFPLEEVELNIPPISEELFKDNKYLDGSDFHIPQSARRRDDEEVKRYEIGLAEQV